MTLANLLFLVAGFLVAKIHSAIAVRPLREGGERIELTAERRAMFVDEAHRREGDEMI